VRCLLLVGVGGWVDWKGCMGWGRRDWMLVVGVY